MPFNNHFYIIALALCTLLGCSSSKDTDPELGIELEKTLSLGVQSMDEDRPLMILGWYFDFPSELMIRKIMTLEFEGSSVTEDGNVIVYASESPWPDDMRPMEDSLYMDPITEGEDISLTVKSFDFELTSIYTAYELSNDGNISGEATATLEVSSGLADPRDFEDLEFTVEVLR